MIVMAYGIQVRDQPGHTLGGCHDLDAFSALLERDGTLLVGVPQQARSSRTGGTWSQSGGAEAACRSARRRIQRLIDSTNTENAIAT